MIFSAVVALLVAAEPRPLPDRTPAQLLAPAARVHLFADDSLEPDVLRALARPRVVLWLRTQSNLLKKSTLDTLNQFAESWVLQRAPVSSVEAEQWRKLSKSGVWVRSGSLSDPTIDRLTGPRRWAVELEPAGWEHVAPLRPSYVVWPQTGDLNLLDWGRFKSMPGRKLIKRPAEQWQPGHCKDEVLAGEPGAWLHAASWMALGQLPFPCGAGAWIEVAPDTESWVLQAIAVRAPSAEVVVDVGADERKVRTARRMLTALGLE